MNRFRFELRIPAVLFYCYMIQIAHHKFSSPGLQGYMNLKVTDDVVTENF
jgi:hypothetical protein